MNLDDLQKKLERGYHSMLTQIEELVSKEGKSVKEAVEHAEQKISDWEELSKEEVTKIRDEVERDLGSLGEELNHAKEVFKNQANLDARYLAASAWDKLSQIADKSTLQLIQFKEALQDQVQEAVGTTHQNADRDYRRWHREHELWVEEMELWKNQHNEAITKLQAIQQSNARHAEALAEHAQTTLAHQTKGQENITEGSPNDVLDDAEQQQHAEEDRLHADHAKSHADIKSHHQKMMGLIDRLYRLGDNR